MKKFAVIAAAALLVISLTVTALAAAETAAPAATDTQVTTSVPAVQRDKTGGKHGNITGVSSTDIAATILGITAEEIKAAEKAGTSLYNQLVNAGKLDAFKSAYLAALKTKLDAAVTAGTITQTSADEKYASAQEKLSAWDGSTSLSGKDKGGHGKGGDRSKSGVKVDVISVAASVLDKTVDEVKESVKTGKVGDLLVAAGKVDAFKTAYLAEAKTKLDAAVTAGTLTQAQADEKYTAEQTKMASYDGTQHLCGGTDHSKMSGRGNKTVTENGNAA